VENKCTSHQPILRDIRVPKLVEIWLPSGENNFAQFFGTRCICSRIYSNLHNLWYNKSAANRYSGVWTYLDRRQCRIYHSSVTDHIAPLVSIATARHFQHRRLCGDVSTHHGLATVLGPNSTASISCRRLRSQMYIFIEVYSSRLDR